MFLEPDKILARAADASHAPAQPCDRNRGIGGTAAAHGHELAGVTLAVDRRDGFHPIHLVEHDDAGAEDARGFALNQRSLPRPRRE